MTDAGPRSGDPVELDLADDLALALAVADEADALTLPPFLARDFSTDWKANRTEVTEIDRLAEQVIVDRLVAARPTHGALGEEHGRRGVATSPWRWVVDPIDGTSGFVRGIPVWATLIALVHADEGAVLGVVSAPALGHRWWGGRGLGAHRAAFGETRPIQVSTVDELTDAQVSVVLSDGWERLGLTGRLVALQQRARRARGLGDFWQHVLVAEGAVDVAVDAVGVAEYDVAALLPIVEAAGGRLTDRHGTPTHRHHTAISTNGRLHDTVLALLST
jgi:histidinol-phosphatase